MAEGFLSAEELAGMRGLASRLKVCVLAIADEPTYPIVFSSYTDHLLEWTSEELYGKSLEALLPNSVHGRHSDLMQGFKLRAESAEGIGMSGGRTVSAIAKSGLPVPVRISISFHPSKTGDRPGTFLALLQNPEKVEIEDEQVDRLLIDFAAISAKSQAAIRSTRKAIAAKVTASGGVLGFVVWLLTQITPLGSAIKGFVAVWQRGDKTPGTEILIAEAVSDRSRFEALILIRNSLIRRDRRVVAVGYYEWQRSDYEGPSIRYITDSGSIDGKEVWFFDRTEDALVLTPTDVERLNYGECIWRGNAAGFPTVKGFPKLNLILCPTFVVKGEQSTGLKRLVLKNLVGVAVTQDIKSAEPIGTQLWVYTPSIENLF